MACKICLSKPYKNQMCKLCFNENVEARLRKEIRELDLKKGTKVFLENTKDTSYYVLTNSLSRIKFIVTLLKKKTKGCIVITPWSADQEIAEFFDEFSKKTYKRVQKIRLPKTLTLEEIEAYAQLKNLKLGKTKFKNKLQELIHEELQKLDKKYTGINKGTVKSITDIEKFLKPL